VDGFPSTRQRALSMSDVWVGLDVGTTGARAVGVDAHGAVVADAAAGYELARPRPGWTEQRPEDWWSASQEALGKVAAGVGDRVVGIGLTGQMHGSVFLDEDLKVIRPALLWNDQRTEAQCVTITELIGSKRLVGISGNPALTGFQAPKVMWLRDEEPDSFRRIKHVLLPKDYVRLKLTGELATDVSDASGSLFLDIRERKWSLEILEALEVPSEWLPAVHESPEVAGLLQRDVAERLGLSPRTPVAAGGGDNAAAGIGTGIIDEGFVSTSLGTSGVVFTPTRDFRFDPSGRLHAFCHAVPGGHHLMGVTLSAAGSLAWWRRIRGEGLTYGQLAQEAESAPPGSEGLVFLPYLSGERTPHLDASSRGAFFGLSARHDAAHMTRAVMEGVVFSLKESLEIMRELGVEVTQIRATGGGARNALWRRLQADIFDAPIYRTETEEGPAYGAALLSAVACGDLPDVRHAGSLVKLKDEVAEPDRTRVGIYRDYFEAYRDLYPATHETMATLTHLASG
jgi:xylulokinase